jgi:hypothetical protein
MKKTIDFPRAKAWVCISEGVVSHEKTWSETRVHGGGGGMIVNAHAVHVQPVSIRSTVTEKNEFWITEDDGHETSVQLHNSAFPVRPGQRVRVAWGAHAKASSGSFLFARNFASNQRVDLIGNWYNWAMQNRLVKTPLLYRLATTWLPLLLAFFFALLIVTKENGFSPRAAANSKDAQVLRAVSEQWLLRGVAAFATEGVGGMMARTQRASRQVGVGDAVEATVSLIGTGVHDMFSPTTLRGGAESAESELVRGAAVIGLLLWLPLLLLFKVVGHIVFFRWWGMSQHRRIRRRMLELIEA